MTFRITLFLSSGAALVTHETHEGEDGSEESLGNVISDVVKEIEDREDPWKTIGDLTVHFKHIEGFRVEAIATAGGTE